MNREKIKGEIAAILYRLYSLTFRYKIEVPESILENLNRKKREKGDGMLFAFWHQDELALLPYFGGKKVTILVSHSRDGTIMNKVLRRFGYDTVRGSTKKRGHSGFLSAFKKILRGSAFAMAVDGPRGPIHEAKGGMSLLSKKSKLPIYPIHAYPLKYKRLEKSWNKGRFPMPFTKIIVKIGEVKSYSTEELTEVLNKMRMD
ncbi:MAG: DUF374 domain-containing protein [Desulfobacterales bacterium]|nr:DUF374 domain-containing protein [Desulfobacterales bacterium]